MTLPKRQDFTKIERLLLNWEACCPRQIDEDEPKIKVNRMIKKFGKAYEELRIILDGDRGHNNCYKAIRRILIRLVLMEKRESEIVPHFLIEELIRGDFLENNTVPKSDINLVLSILNKYIALMNKISVKISQAVISQDISKRCAKKTRREINEWLLSLTAREVEKFLVSKKKEEAIINCMYEYMAEKIDIEDLSLSTREKNIQVYLAVQRAFLQSNDDTLSYDLFNLECPNWQHSDDNELDLIAKKIFKIQKNVKRRLKHPIGDNLKSICARYVVYFIVLSDLLNKIGATELAKLLKERTNLENKIVESVKESYGKAKKRVRNGLIVKTFYVLLTKTVLIKFLELNFNFSMLELIGIVFLGPTFMVATGLSISTPPDKNTKKIVKVFNRMFFEDRIRSVKYEVKQVSFPLIKNSIFTIIYLATFAAVIFGIYKLLIFFRFGIFSTSLILFFFSMVAYFGFCLRAIVREYVVLDYEENFLGFLFDLISLPILTAGKLLAYSANQMNIFRWGLDHIVEVPYKIFVNFFDHWMLFVKERKDGLEKGDY